MRHLSTTLYRLRIGILNIAGDASQFFLNTFCGGRPQRLPQAAGTVPRTSSLAHQGSPDIPTSLWVLGGNGGSKWQVSWEH